LFVVALDSDSAVFQLNVKFLKELGDKQGFLGYLRQR
jgi:hypothetical protein